MKMFLLAILLVPLLTFAAYDVLFTIYGETLEYRGQPAHVQNRIELSTKAGEQLLLSKGLVDWEATWRRNPTLVAALKPDLARRLEQKLAQRNPARRIVIDNDALNRRKERQSTGLIAKSETVATSSNASAPLAKTIAHGEVVHLAEHMDGSRVVIVDFYADWCGPCRVFTPQLMAFAEKYPERVAILKIDIVNWGSPVARQFGIKSIPFVMVYSREGGLLEKGGAGRMMTYLNNKASREQW